MWNEVVSPNWKEVDDAERQVVRLYGRLYEKNGVGQDLALKFLKRGILGDVQVGEDEERAVDTNEYSGNTRGARKEGFPKDE